MAANFTWPQWHCSANNTTTTHNRTNKSHVLKHSHTLHRCIRHLRVNFGYYLLLRLSGVKRRQTLLRVFTHACSAAGTERSGSGPVFLWWWWCGPQSPLVVHQSWSMRQTRGGSAWSFDRLSQWLSQPAVKQTKNPNTFKSFVVFSFLKGRFVDSLHL